MSRGGHFRNISTGPLQKKKPIPLTVAQLGPNNLIGEDDIFDQAFNRTTVKCISQTGELFVFQKEDFEKCKGFSEVGTRTGNFYITLRKEIDRKLQKYIDAIKARNTWAKQTVALGAGLT